MALDLGGEKAVRAAVARIGAPVVLQRYVTGGAEVLAGALQDPTFGRAGSSPASAAALRLTRARTAKSW